MSEQPARVVEPEDRLGMTEEQWERFQAYTHGFGEQDEHGVDVSLLRESLRLTPSQRVEQLLRGLALFRSGTLAAPQPTFGPFFVALRSHDVRYLLIGGVAMRCHGSRYLTDDLDLYYARDAENLGRLAEALAPFHPRLRGVTEDLPFRWDTRTLRSGLNFTLTTDAGALDLLGEVPGADSFKALWDRATEVELLGTPVRVASLDDLIAMKRAAGREKDRGHLLELERLRTLPAEGEAGEGPG
jgi:predicted nucleotidyltransferase